MTTEEIQKRVTELGDWFHNMNLGGVQTAPNHFLGDYPSIKWRKLKSHIPADLTGKTVLDIGCNAGFYAIHMKHRGASRVVGIDSDSRYLEQACFAARVSRAAIDFRLMDVYQVAELKERFDIVLFMGVLYHLRHPLLALDLLHKHVVKDTLIFQSLLRGHSQVAPLKKNYPFAETDIFGRPGFPLMYFVEHSYADDPTNWWIPNRACAEAMLRSAGFVIKDHAGDEIYVCKRKGRRHD